MDHYIITRFSVLDTKNKSFQLTRKHSVNTIKQKLFNPVRLDTKFALFEAMTYPSVMNQTYNDYTWLIYASQYLPESYKDKLNGFKGDTIKIIFVKNFKEMNTDINNRIRNSTNYSTIRLDDDDGLNPAFLETINKYETEKGKIISIPKGRWYRLHNGEIQIRGKIYHKKNAQGLAAIGFNIYTSGNHMNINEKHEVVYNDKMKNAFYRSCSNTSNTRKKCS